MDANRARTNKRVLVTFGLIAVALATLALWGFSQRATPPPSPAAVVQSAMTEAQARAEVLHLLAELDSFKGLAGFHGAGFSSKGLLAQPARWHKDATALQQRIVNDTALPPVLRAAPGMLLGLGLAYRSSKGQETAGTRGDRELLLEAVK